jgi:hypothetical protein
VLQRRVATRTLPSGSSYSEKKSKIKKNINWTELPKSRSAAEKGGDKDSALGKLLFRKKSKNIVRVKREARPRLWEIGTTRTLFSGRALSRKTAGVERELNLNCLRKLKKSKKASKYW